MSLLDMPLGRAAAAVPAITCQEVTALLADGRYIGPFVRTLGRAQGAGWTDLGYTPGWVVTPSLPILVLWIAPTPQDAAQGLRLCAPILRRAGLRLEPGLSPEGHACLAILGRAAT